MTVTQMYKKSEGVTCTVKRIVGKMWKQWCIKGRKEKSKDDIKEETNLAKVDDKAKEKGKGVAKEKMARRKKL
jgi:hypothetical protein